MKKIIRFLFLFGAFNLHAQVNPNISYNDLHLTCVDTNIAIEGIHVLNIEIKNNVVHKEYYNILIHMDKEGRELISQITSNHIGEMLSIFSNDREIVSARIVEPITDGVISLQTYTDEKANEIFELLKADGQ